MTIKFCVFSTGNLNIEKTQNTETFQLNVNKTMQIDGIFKAVIIFYTCVTK